MKKLNLPANGVCIVWKWEWISDDIDHESEAHDIQPEKSDCEVVSETDMSSEDCDTQAATGMTHTVTFKCIGANRSPTSQNILKTISELPRNVKDTPVIIVPEPENPVDSEAIAFRAKISDKWHTIGYIVREALPYVHDALKRNVIQSVTFGWVKYLVSWTRSGPGYYAGFDITIEGKWPQDVVRCASTR